MRVLPGDHHNNLGLYSRLDLYIEGALLRAIAELLADDCDNRVLLLDSQNVAIPPVAVGVRQFHRQFLNITGSDVLVLALRYLLDIEHVDEAGNATVPGAVDDAIPVLPPALAPGVLHNPVALLGPASEQYHMVDLVLGGHGITSRENPARVEQETGVARPHSDRDGAIID